MSTVPPLVSVIIPVWDGEAFIEETLQSVFVQTYQPLEIIVVDDGSLDATPALVKKYAAVRYLRQENTGAAAARNWGVRHARGEFIAFLDADDLWTPDKLEQQMLVFRNNPKIDIAFCYLRKFYTANIDFQAPAEPGYITSAAVIKAQVFFDVGPFSTELHAGEFIDWYNRASEHGCRSFMIAEAALLRRIHENNMGKQKKSDRRDYMKLVKAALDRRRDAGQ